MKKRIKPKNAPIRPYGDQLDDGFVQMSFTLPVSADLAPEAAQQLAAKMGLSQVRTVHASDLGDNFTAVVVYGKCTHAVNVTDLKISHAVDQSMGFDEINRTVMSRLKRKIVIVGACIESDAHTVGIDAILNMKGYHGDYGLERYEAFQVTNMGAQVPCEELIARARTQKADAILVSQVVTQQNIHLHNLTRLIDMLEAENVRSRFLCLVGGPFLDNRFAKELGYDAGFGRGTVPSQVATYLCREIIRNKKGK